MAGFVLGLLDRDHHRPGLTGCSACRALGLLHPGALGHDQGDPRHERRHACSSARARSRSCCSCATRLPKLPRALIVMALAIMAVKAFDLQTHGVAMTGDMPTGLFSIGTPGIGWSDSGALLLGALSVDLRRLLRVAGRRPLDGVQARIRDRPQPGAHRAGNGLRHGRPRRRVRGRRQPVEDVRRGRRRPADPDGLARQRRLRVAHDPVPREHLREPCRARRWARS